MLLDEFVEIRFNPNMCKYYINLGYTFTGFNDKFICKITDLHPGSYTKVRVKCDVCGNEKIISYKAYLKNIKNGGYYSCSSKCSREKVKNTCMERYGVESTTSLEWVQDKMKATSIKHFGVPHCQQNEEIKEKTKQTQNELYGGMGLGSKSTSKKIKKTNKEKYGYEMLMQTPEFKEKTKITNVKLYGTENVFASDIIKEKIKDFYRENFGVEHNMQLDSCKEKRTLTYIDRYGFDHATKSEIVKNKTRQTKKEHCGYENNTQNPEMFHKMQMNSFKAKLYKDTTLSYQGSYEYDFLEFCEKYNIVVENGPSLRYIHNNKNRVYHSDFYLPKYNLIIEVKSVYYYNTYLNKNLAKRIGSIKLGYDFLFIIDKKYDGLKILLDL
jgi:hypothetical protein